MEWLIEDAIGVKVAAGTAYERHFFTALGSLCMQHWPLLALAGTFLAAIAGAFMFRTDVSMGALYKGRFGNEPGELKPCSSAVS